MIRRDDRSSELERRMVDRNTTIGLLVIVVIVMATVSVRPQARALAITHVNVVDVIDGRILPDSTVTIRGQTIASVTRNSAAPRGQRGREYPGWVRQHDCWLLRA
jgi:hypothetical protein